MATVLMEEMTSPQIREAISAGYRTAIVPVGAVEQHGRHLPIGTDAFDAYLTGEAIARHLGHALVASPIRPGCSDHHMAFAGTLTISKELLQELVRAYCRALAHHGFEHIVLIATHGGNIPALSEVAPELDGELPCRVVHANILRDPGPKQATDPILQHYGITRDESGLHSGFTETSLMLDSPWGKFVDMSEAQRGYVGDARARIQEVSQDGHWNMTDISPIGVIGDPTKSTLEAGRALWDALIPAYADVVRAALTSE
jgi:creatinine amidohydrolase